MSISNRFITSYRASAGVLKQLLESLCAIRAINCLRSQNREVTTQLSLECHTHLSSYIVKALIAILTVLLILLQIKLWTGHGSVPKVWELQNALEMKRQEKKRMIERNQVLEAEVSDLKSGLEAVEERARLELGMIKKGETFFQVIEPPRESKAGR